MKLTQELIRQLAADAAANVVSTGAPAADSHNTRTIEFAIKEALKFDNLNSNRDKHYHRKLIGQLFNALRDCHDAMIGKVNPDHGSWVTTKLALKAYEKSLTSESANNNHQQIIERLTV